MRGKESNRESISSKSLSNNFARDTRRNNRRFNQPRSSEISYCEILRRDRVLATIFSPFHLIRFSDFSIVTAKKLLALENMINTRAEPLISCKTSVAAVIYFANLSLFITRQRSSSSPRAYNAFPFDLVSLSLFPFLFHSSSPSNDILPKNLRI